jgi:Zn-dependent protease with chaperone function
MRASVWPTIVACSLLGACATSPYSGRPQLALPQPVAQVYSEVNMRLQLVTTRDGQECAESECDAKKAFEIQVARLGYALADQAFEAYPDLRQRFNQFEFVIPQKAEPGTTSNASGTVVVFSGTQALEPSDPALAFIVAREMGHVVAGHHNENSATKMVVSVLAQFLLPVSSVFRAFALLPGASSAAAASATTAGATTGGSIAALTATATAASYLGAEALIATYWPKQLNEADAVALSLLARLGYDPQQTADALAAVEQRLSDSGWPRDLRASSMHVAQIAQGPRPDQERLAQIAGAAPFKLTYVAGEQPAPAPALAPQAVAQ